MLGRATKGGRDSCTEVAGVPSALRLHVATSAHLQMNHDVAKQAANQMAHKDVDRDCFDPRISLAM